jgi:hypothetical protein
MILAMIAGLRYASSGRMLVIVAFPASYQIGAKFLDMA